MFDTAKMFLMCGHPGSGKSTYARAIAAMNHIRYLSIDDMYATFNGDPTSHENKFDVWMTFFRQIHAAEVAWQDVVVDTNAPTRADRLEFLNWFSSFEHYLIWVDADEDLCLANNKRRSRVIPEEQMKSLFGVFEAPAGKEAILNKTRSEWRGIFHIQNENNHFSEPRIIYGAFPKEVVL